MIADQLEIRLTWAEKMSLSFAPQESPRSGENITLELYKGAQTRLQALLSTRKD